MEPRVRASVHADRAPCDAPWTSWEFIHIARIHCWYEDFLATFAHRVLFSDTDAFTTAIFNEVYLGAPAAGFEELVARRYDLFVVCGLDVPWRHDGIREFEGRRRAMHERYLEHARRSGSPWLLVEGPLDVRIEAVAGRRFAARLRRVRVPDGADGVGDWDAAGRRPPAAASRHELGTKLALIRRQTRRQTR